MELTGLSFRNYKAFQGRERLEIRPLTILIGKNSSGKSAIARLPLLLGASLSPRAQAPIELAGDGFDLGGSFVDIVHNKRPHGEVELGASFRDEKGETSFSATVQFYDDLSLQVVKALSVEAHDIAFELARVSEDPGADPGNYSVEVGGRTKLTCEVSFVGLTPSDNYGLEKTGMLGKLAVGLAKPTQVLQDAIYLGPFRESPQRIYRFPGGLPQNVGRAGAMAPAMLAADARRRGAVLREVANWYREHLGGWALDVDMVPTGNTFSIVLRNPREPQVGINIVDAGTGLSQVLPVVTQRLFEQVTGKQASLEIVEQPELHLHPGAHGSLADLYIAASKVPGSRFLIETHSENFLLRVRRRVAEGALPPESVRIYWVQETPSEGSKIVPIEVLSDGEVSDWPEGVFSEDFDELIAIRDAQRARAK